ncbi:MAG: hypothetical protein EP343_13680 [Deltaproteobacteria bacterium]|nr:MAG: hypothetical protein EP343_13680 [Deltaproteobacteria bacterium]
MKERSVRRLVAALSFVLIGSLSSASWAATPSTQKATATKPSPAAAAAAAPKSSAAALLKFFPTKPLAVFRAESLSQIVQDLENIAAHVGFGPQIAMGKMQAFGAAQQFLQLKKPVKSLAGLLDVVGLGANPRLAVGLIETSKRPYFSPVVVLEVGNGSVLNRMVTQTLPLLRDQNRYKRCKRGQRQLQLALQQLMVRNGKKTYTIRDLTRGSYRNLKYTMCTKGVKFKVNGDKVISPSLDGGFDNFRKMHGTQAVVKAAGNVQKVTLDQITYAMVNNRYVVWSLEPAYLDAALKRFPTNKAQYLTNGFATNLTSTARFQFFMDYERYMKMMFKMQNMLQNLNPKAAALPPQIQQLQKLTQSMASGLDSMWMEARVKGLRYQLYSTLTVNKKRSPLMEVFLKIKPGQIRSLSMLSQNTVAVMSMNILQAYFDFASIMLKQMGNKALSQFVFSIGQWKAMFGDEVTLSVGSAPGKPVQAALLIEVKQAQQLQQLLMSLTMMLGAGGKSPLQTTVYNNVPITYVFKGRGARRSGRRSPTDRLPPGELAFAFVNNYFVLTYQMTRKSDLSMLKRMIDPKSRNKSSILNNPTLMRLLQRTKKTNGLLFLSMPELLKAVRMFAPPLPQVMRALRIASSISYIFGTGQMVQSENRSYGIVEMGLRPKK